MPRRIPRLRIPPSNPHQRFAVPPLSATPWLTLGVGLGSVPGAISAPPRLLLHPSTSCMTKFLDPRAPAPRRPVAVRFGMTLWWPPPPPHGGGAAALSGCSPASFSPPLRGPALPTRLLRAPPGLQRLCCPAWCSSKCRPQMKVPRNSQGHRSRTSSRRQHHGQGGTFNFIGRLLGPRGNSLKRIEASTGCHLFIRGKGSIKDPGKEEQLKGRPGYEHLDDPLHILIEAELPVNVIDSRLSKAQEILEELLKPVVLVE